MANRVKCHSVIVKLQEMKTRKTPLKPESARTLLEEALQQFSSLYICIDALDECNQKHRTAFLRLLSDLVRDSRLQLRIFITGRPHVEQCTKWVQ
jgi:type II secretory pathway predicted ATPase ExeA